MILIKRKKIICIGVLIGLLWTVLTYVFNAQDSEQPLLNYAIHKVNTKVEVVRDASPHESRIVHFSKRPLTWLPPNFEDKIISRKHARRRKSKKSKRQPKFPSGFAIANDKKKRIDNNFNKFKDPESKNSKLQFQSQGFGENGRPHKIEFSSLNLSTQNDYHELYKLFGYNALVSSQVSVQRSLPDVRGEACKTIAYSVDSLPRASVIIAFFNEAWSALMRTVHSVLMRTPPSLLEEIILVDDGSTMDHLKHPLSDYFRLLKKVKLLRTSSRLGVVRSRQLGADVSRASVLIFLDSHVEVTPGWAEPLLNRINEDDTAVVTPVMDIIDDETFAYKDFKYESINIGAFTWALQFAWIGVPSRVKQKLTSETDPISSPTMPGGMFAIGRKQFLKLGGFDPGMDMWGGENFEMSFKIWMCGGKLETIPCSHVGHVFRKGSVYKLENSLNEKKNFQRVAEVWMDEYKTLYYQRTKTSLGNIGDVSERQELRRKLKCQSFEWYINNVYPEMFVSSKALISGEIRNYVKAHGDGVEFSGCIDGANSQAKSLSVWPCHGQGGNQMWMLSAEGEIRNDDNCFDFAGINVVLFPCHGHRGNQEWIFTTSSGEIVHKGTQLCLGLSTDLTKLSMEKCNQESRQKWLWGDTHKRELTSFKAPKVDPIDYIRQENALPGEGDYYEDEEIQFTKTKPPEISKKKDSEYEYYEDEDA